MSDLTWTDGVPWWALLAGFAGAGIALWLAGRKDGKTGDGPDRPAA